MSNTNLKINDYVMTQCAIYKILDVFNNNTIYLEVIKDYDKESFRRRSFKTCANLKVFSKHIKVINGYLRILYT